MLGGFGSWSPALESAVLDLTCHSEGDVRSAAYALLTRRLERPGDDDDDDVAMEGGPTGLAGQTASRVAAGLRGAASEAARTLPHALVLLPLLTLAAAAGGGGGGDARAGLVQQVLQAGEGAALGAGAVYELSVTHPV